ncbi:MAG TPA: hypothetical protein VGG09_00635, partial [Acidimicrobiales bacterium]
GAVLVTESRNTAIDAVSKAKDLLTRNQTRLLGVVLNKFQRRDAGTFGYGYGYGYGDTPEPYTPPETARPQPPPRDVGPPRPRSSPPARPPRQT